MIDEPSEQTLRLLSVQIKVQNMFIPVRTVKHRRLNIIVRNFLINIETGLMYPCQPGTGSLPVPHHKTAGFRVIIGNKDIPILIVPELFMHQFLVAAYQFRFLADCKTVSRGHILCPVGDHLIRSLCRSFGPVDMTGNGVHIRILNGIILFYLIKSISGDIHRILRKLSRRTLFLALSGFTPFFV